MAVSVSPGTVSVTFVTYARNRRTSARPGSDCHPIVTGRCARSCQKWGGSDSGRVATSQTAVSAPSSASRSTGLLIMLNIGRCVATPGVSTQPGCIDSTLTSRLASLVAQASARTTCIRLVRA